jgi:hypothetical protein
VSPGSIRHGAVNGCTIVQGDEKVCRPGRHDLHGEVGGDVRGGQPQCLGKASWIVDDAAEPWRDWSMAISARTMLIGAHGYGQQVGADLLDEPASRPVSQATG